tara:strand:+ start:523 stop:993 length:471 start_codon:yes stop_codon:yes gene_type:complete
MSVVKDGLLGGLIGGWAGSSFAGHVFIGPLVSGQLDLLVIQAAEAIVAGTEFGGYSVAVTTTKAAGQVLLGQAVVVAAGAGIAGGVVGGTVERAVTKATGNKAVGVAAGVVSGAATGAAVGAAIGAAFGGIGAAPGAAIGAVAGAIGALVVSVWPW